MITSTPIFPPAASNILLTPAATIFTASTSRPESVSSMMAISGSSIAIWRISARFFSPPLNPSLMYRPRIAGSICSSSTLARASF